MNPPELATALQRYFGYASFREGQEEIVRRAVEGLDTLAVMPTGAGKSLCYQLAAMLRPTPTLVISPLIALMKDQVDNLPPGVAACTSLINSSLPPDEVVLRMRKLAAGQYKLLYVAPERLRQRSFVSVLETIGVGLVVVDEAHCVSMWGHDFRPDYLFIRSALELLDSPAVLGLTATASPETADDISSSLGRDLEVVRSSVDRPNLRYEVEHVENEEARLRSMLARVRELKGSGIIYARSREKCESLARLLARNGVRALHYHAGLDPDERSRAQERFLGGESRVVVATTAFGMGIDKPDIRWILLYNFPDSLESYVQMVGRAGRDGEPGVCILLASRADAANLRRFARADIPSVDQLRSVYRQLRGRAQGGWVEVTREALSPNSDSDSDPRVLIGILERAGLLKRHFDSQRSICIELLPAASDTAGRIEALLARYESQSLARVDRIVAFAGSRHCRHLQVARHFGEVVDVPCAMCDVCDPNTSTEATPTSDSRPLPENIAEVIVEAVGGLSWPVGTKGLTALLKGSVSAPPSTQRSASFGALSAAKESAIKRWIAQLVEHGNLEVFESDGYRLLRPGGEPNLPRLAATGTTGKRGAADAEGAVTMADAAFFEQLRAWRSERSREADVPAFVIMQDRVLREVVTTRPRSKDELLGITGIGPAKVERYGDDLLRLVREAD